MPGFTTVRTTQFVFLSWPQRSIWLLLILQRIIVEVVFLAQLDNCIINEIIQNEFSVSKNSDIQRNHLSERHFSSILLQVKKISLYLRKSNSSHSTQQKQHDEFYDEAQLSLCHQFWTTYHQKSSMRSRGPSKSSSQWSDINGMKCLCSHTCVEKQQMKQKMPVLSVLFFL